MAFGILSAVGYGYSRCFVALVDARDLLDDPGCHQHENEDDGAEREPPAALLSGEGFFRSHANR